MQFLPQPATPDRGEKGGTTNALKPQTTTSDPTTQPVVSVLSTTLTTGADTVDPVQYVLENWLLANLDSFNRTFAAVDLGAVADKDQFSGSTRRTSATGSTTLRAPHRATTSSASWR